MPPKLDLIGIIVRDMPAALNFYRQLGWDIPAAMDTEGHVEYVLPSGLRIAWDTQEVIRMFEPDWQPPTGSHRGGMAFLCANPAEVDALYARLTGMGYASHKAPWDAFWGQHYALVEDADGNVVDLFCPLEQSS